MLLSFLAWLGASFLGAYLFSVIKRPHCSKGIPIPVSKPVTGPLLFQKERQKSAPKINDDAKAWMAENER